MNNNKIPEHVLKNIKDDAWKYADGYSRTNEQKFIMADSYVAAATKYQSLLQEKEREIELLRESLADAVEEIDRLNKVIEKLTNGNDVSVTKTGENTYQIVFKNSGL